MAEVTVDRATGIAIPVIDFADFTDGDAAARAATAAAIRRAFEEFGFLYLHNHGVPQGVVDEMFAQSRAFFSLPAEVKRAAAWVGKTSDRGYTAPANVGLDATKPLDLRETFKAGSDAFGPTNNWPEGRPAFRAAVLAYYDAASQVCERIMHAVATSLGLPEDYFDAAHRQHGGSTSLLHYPPLSGEPLPGQLRAGAHTDWGTITLLFQDDMGGLEVLGPEGTWLPAPSLPGTAIVNSADLLTRWTNGQFRSVMHRVVNPVGPAAARSRYSAVLFYQPRGDAVVTCLEPCQGPDRPEPPPPVTAHDYFLGRLKEARRISD
jgi:isopenicillin N synthase-like dioxygenase